MARLAEQRDLDAEIRRKAAQQNMCKELKCRFGWAPESVQCLKEGRDVQGICSVTVGPRRTVLFVFANGLLVGIPPKKGRGF